jgi:type II secretory pathway component PulF
MLNFRYNATNSAGKWVSGEIHAPTREEAVARLKADGLVVEGLIDAEERPMSRTLSRSDLVEMVEQLTALTKAGVPLPSGLRAAANEMISPSLRSTFLNLASKLESGASLEEALSSNGGWFPAELRGLIQAGSRSGRLADLLCEFVRSANLGSELRRMFWGTLLYPTLTLIALLAIVWFVCLIAVQATDNLLRDFGVNQPASTMLLTAVARLIASHGVELLTGIILLPILIWVTIRLTNGPAKRRQMLCGVPLIGPIIRYCSLTEFCHRLAMLLEAQLPLPLAFELAGSSVGDAEVAEACVRMGRAVEEGQPLSRAVNLWAAVPAGLDQLFRWSEDRRSLPEALHLAGDMFEARARSQSSFARSVLSAALLLLIIWWIGFAVAALFLPLISLISRLSG